MRDTALLYIIVAASAEKYAVIVRQSTLAVRVIIRSCLSSLPHVSFEFFCAYEYFFVGTGNTELCNILMSREVRCETLLSFEKGASRLFAGTLFGDRCGNGCADVLRCGVAPLRYQITRFLIKLEKSTVKPMRPQKAGAFCCATLTKHEGEIWRNSLYQISAKSDTILASKKHYRRCDRRITYMPRHAADRRNTYGKPFPQTYLQEVSRRCNSRFRLLPRHQG